MCVCVCVCGCFPRLLSRSLSLLLSSLVCGVRMYSVVVDDKRRLRSKRAKFIQKAHDKGIYFIPCFIRPCVFALSTIHLSVFRLLHFDSCWNPHCMLVTCFGAARDVRISCKYIAFRWWTFRFLVFEFLWCVGCIQLILCFGCRGDDVEIWARLWGAVGSGRAGVCCCLRFW